MVQWLMYIKVEVRVRVYSVGLCSVSSWFLNIELWVLIFFCGLLWMMLMDGKLLFCGELCMNSISSIMLVVLSVVVDRQFICQLNLVIIVVIIIQVIVLLILCVVDQMLQKVLCFLMLYQCVSEIVQGLMFIDCVQLLIFQKMVSSRVLVVIFIIRFILVLSNKLRFIQCIMLV